MVGLKNVVRPLCLKKIILQYNIFIKLFYVSSVSLCMALEATSKHLFSFLISYKTKRMVLLFVYQNFHVGGCDTAVISDWVHFFIEAENFRSVMMYLF